jgi:Ca2+-binding RTX toxin-like protein
MPIVTVPGANHSTISLLYDRGANADLARLVSAEISAGLAGGTIFAADNKSGTPPSLSSPVIGELVVSKSGTTLLSPRYDFVVDSAKTAVVFGNGAANEQVLAGNGDLTFFATGGSGSVITGGGDNMVVIPSSDPGNWLIALGNGDDSVRALGGGNDTISLGSGRGVVQLGSGNTFLTTSGPDTIQAGGGSETIDASGHGAKELIFGGSSSLFFVAGGAATVYGGTGSDTVFGGSGKELLEGGSAGGNFLQAGDGQATLFGGGDGDQLFAAGHEAQALHAAGGNETLSGAFASGRDSFYGGSGHDLIFGGSGQNSFTAGTGSATVTASPGAMNLFEFMKTLGGGTELVMGLTDVSQVHIDLDGYNSNEVKFALAHQVVTGDGVTVTLSDHTTVTFENIGSLSSKNFSGFSMGGADDAHGHTRMSDDHGKSDGHGRG